MTLQPPCTVPKYPMKTTKSTTATTTLKRKKTNTQIIKDIVFVRMGFLFCCWEARTQHAVGQRAVLCVDHFGSAVTILDEACGRVESQNGGGFPLLRIEPMSGWVQLVIRAIAGCA